MNMNTREIVCYYFKYLKIIKCAKIKTYQSDQIICFQLCKIYFYIRRI